MVKAPAGGPTGGPTGPGIYGATYSGIPVFEFQFGADLKEHVMRRRVDDWINATHILKAAGFDKPARTRILEREVQKDTHEKIQGGYGKYQGTWIPLEAGENLAQRNNIYERLRPIFAFIPGPNSPPPAPRHQSKPKAPKNKAPAAPKWAPPPVVREPEVDTASIVTPIEDETPDNVTVLSASYMAEDDGPSNNHHHHLHHAHHEQQQQSQNHHHLHHDNNHNSINSNSFMDHLHSHDGASADFQLPQVPSSAASTTLTGQRKRKREQELQELTDQQHSQYGDELLDYFLLSRRDAATARPEPPPNFQPDYPIDNQSHTALHWASAMGDVDVIRQLKRFGARLDSRNARYETPFMWCVNFTNSADKQTFPTVMRELFDTVDAQDAAGATVLHHAATMKNNRLCSHSTSRYYLDNILNYLQENYSVHHVQALIDARDHQGNTALHLAAKYQSRKGIRALLGRGAAPDIPNGDGVLAEDMIRHLNAATKTSTTNGHPLHHTGNSSRLANHPHHNLGLGRFSARSSSPFAPPESGARPALSFRDDQLAKPFASDAANSVQNRITPLVLEKFQDLAQSYEDQWKEKQAAEAEARRILANTQNELAVVLRQVADLQGKLVGGEGDEGGGEAEAAQVRARLLTAVRELGDKAVEVEVASAVSVSVSPGNGAEQVHQQQEGEEEEDTPQLRAQLHQQLADLSAEQRAAEEDFIEALALSGTGEKIDKYRRLLENCLDTKDAESLNRNLDDLIEMMEEQRGAGVGVGVGVGVGPASAEAVGGGMGMGLGMPGQQGAVDPMLIC